MILAQLPDSFQFHKYRPFNHQVGQVLAHHTLAVVDGQPHFLGYMDPDLAISKARALAYTHSRKP